LLSGSTSLTKACTGSSKNTTDIRMSRAEHKGRCCRTTQISGNALAAHVISGVTGLRCPTPQRSAALTLPWTCHIAICCIARLIESTLELSMSSDNMLRAILRRSLPGDRGVPMLMSPAVQRACTQWKTILPQRTATGWDCTATGNFHWSRAIVALGDVARISTHVWAPVVQAVSVWASTNSAGKDCSRLSPPQRWRCVCASFTVSR